MIFSDESTIAVLEDRVQSVRRRQGEEFKPECLKKTLKFPSKIMVWGAISVHGPSRLHIVEGTMNGAKYISMLNSRLLPQIRNWFEQEPCIFQQDSAPCHTAKAVYAWFKTNKIKVLKWPGNSPDMNPIESMWNQLKDEIHNVPITTKVQLIERLIQVWFHSPKIRKMCQDLIKGMPKRVEALKNAKGGQTKY